MFRSVFIDSVYVKLSYMDISVCEYHVWWMWSGVRSPNVIITSLGPTSSLSTRNMHNRKFDPQISFFLSNVVFVIEKNIPKFIGSARDNLTVLRLLHRLIVRGIPSNKTGPPST